MLVESRLQIKRLREILKHNVQFIHINFKLLLTAQRKRH